MGVTVPSSVHLVETVRVVLLSKLLLKLILHGRVHHVGWLVRGS